MHIKQLGVNQQFNHSSSLHSFWINISKEQVLDKLLIFIKVIVEYAFGTHVGFAIGWVIGLYVGYFYVEHFEPVHLDDLSQLSYWRLVPYIFARNGAVIGVVVGMIAIAVINSRSFNRRVASSYKDEIDNPNDIARLLGESAGQNEREMSRWSGNHSHKAARCK